MKLKALIITLTFIFATFTGAAMAAWVEQPGAGGYDWRDGAAEGQRGVPEQESRPGQPFPGQERQAALAQADQVPGMFSADNLQGQSVTSRNGEHLGSINDLVISRDGRVEYIILSRGGFLGLGTDLVPIPWQAARLQAGADNQLTTAITPQQLEGAPSLGELAILDEQQVHSYYGTEPRMEYQPGFDQRERPFQQDRMYRQPAN
jgi:sporulation protein YlmC with PRC-barrel domain